MKLDEKNMTGPRVRALLAARGGMNAAAVAVLLGLPRKRVEAALATLARDGIAEQGDAGIWRLRAMQRPRRSA